MIITIRNRLRGEDMSNIIEIKVSQSERLQ